MLLFNSRLVTLARDGSGNYISYVEECHSATKYPHKTQLSENGTPPHKLFSCRSAVELGLLMIPIFALQGKKK